MSRISTIISSHDSAGDYESEVFDTATPKYVLVCAHGNGVRRWDGAKFYYQVADYFTDAAVLLVDQNQPVGDGVSINALPILISRVQSLITLAIKTHPGVPVYVVAHSMGCSVATGLDLQNVAGMFFVAPAAGEPAKSLVQRYGESIKNGQKVLTSDGLTKIITKEYYDSVLGIVWEDEYTKLVNCYSPVYVYEAGQEEIVGEDRFAHRNIAFTGYEIINEAKHNFTGEPAKELFQKIESTINMLPAKST